MLHDNAEITKIDKFNYLHSLLEGASAHSIQTKMVCYCKRDLEGHNRSLLHMWMHC